jgi:hypothetical protein
MTSDTLLKNEGMTVLAERLGLVRAERFITLMIREPFDYTEWQRDLYEDVPLEKLLRDAMDYRTGQRTCAARTSKSARVKSGKTASAV